MENAGAVFFRETLLLVDHATISLAEKKRVAEVIAHELAHMWFGNLVTMKWWDDLWLNEAFATWMAFKVVDEWKPEWRMWNNFEPHRAAALALDALANTHPVYAEVENAAQATENFDAITYEKGASVVRMVEHYLGPQKFRAGVQAYIRQHREGNAVAADLWNALEKASGQPVRADRARLGAPAGLPAGQLRARGRRQARRARGQAGALQGEPDHALRRRRRRRPGRCRWWSSSAPAGRAPRTERFLLRRAKERIAVPGGKPAPWYYGNVGEGGFYRVLHDPDVPRGAGARARDVADAGRAHGPARPPVGDRARRPRAHRELPRPRRARSASETDYEVLDALAGPLAFIDDQIVDAVGPECRGTVPGLARRGVRPARGASSAGSGGRRRPTKRNLRRGSLLRILGLIGEDARHRRGRRAGLRALPEGPRERRAEPRRSADRDRRARRRRRRASRASARRSGNSRTPQESRRFQLALGDFRDPTLAQRAAELTLTPEIPTQDVGFLLMRLLGNRAAREATWEFIQANWGALAKRLPPMMVSRVIEATASLQTREHASRSRCSSARIRSRPRRGR